MRNPQQVHHSRFPTASLGNLTGCQLKMKQNDGEMDLNQATTQKLKTQAFTYGFARNIEKAIYKIAF